MIRKLSTKLSRGWSDRNKIGPTVSVRLSANTGSECRLTENQGTGSDPISLKLLEAINNENETDLERILTHSSVGKGVVLFKDINGATLLHLACSRSNAATVDRLLRYGFDVNAKTEQDLELYLEAYDYVSKIRPGSTPLYIATVSGLHGLISMLLKNGANPDIADADGYTPMHSAAWHNKTNLISIFISNGAKLNLQDSTGSTPLRKAAYRGNMEAVKQLLNNGADPNIKTKRGRTALHCAALYGHSEVVSLLIEHGAKIDLVDNDNMTALHAAVYNGKRRVVKLLLNVNADVHITTKFGNTPLHLACMEKWLVIANMLVQAGANSTLRNRFGESPESILQAGDAGNRVAVLQIEAVALPLAEIEKLESEQKEKTTQNMSEISHEIQPANGNAINGERHKGKKEKKNKERKETNTELKLGN